MGNRIRPDLRTGMYFRMGPYWYYIVSREAAMLYCQCWSKPKYHRAFCMHRDRLLKFNLEGDWDTSDSWYPHEVSQLEFLMATGELRKGGEK